jgi:hypothetical protein
MLAALPSAQVGTVQHAQSPREVLGFSAGNVTTCSPGEIGSGFAKYPGRWRYWLPPPAAPEPLPACGSTCAESATRPADAQRHEAQPGAPAADASRTQQRVLTADDATPSRTPPRRPARNPAPASRGLPLQIRHGRLLQLLLLSLVMAALPLGRCGAYCPAPLGICTTSSELVQFAQNASISPQPKNPAAANISAITGQPDYAGMRCLSGPPNSTADRQAVFCLASSDPNDKSPGTITVTFGASVYVRQVCVPALLGGRGARERRGDRLLPMRRTTGTVRGGGGMFGFRGRQGNGWR